MNKKAVAWLYEQLPELVEKGIIPGGSIELIQNHFGPVDKRFSSRTALTLFGLIGAVLIGLGIILIFAHNWEQLDKMARTVIAVGILLLGQNVAGIALWFKKDSAAWTESASAFLMVTIGASIAIIGQTYHIADDFSNYILIWMLVSIPVVYIMDVKTPALLYLIGVTIWVVTKETSDIDKQFIWILLAFLGPYYRKLVKIDAYANPIVLFSWIFIVCFYIAFGMAFGTYMTQLSFFIDANLVAITYFIGVLWFNESAKIWQMPFKVIGLIGCIGLSFLLTFQDIWLSLKIDYSSLGKMEIVLALLLLAITVFLGNKLVNRNQSRHLFLSAAPVIAGIGFLLLLLDDSGINAILLCNAYVLSLSVYFILRGIREGAIGTLNIGMLLVSALIIMRFLDANFSFVTRGLLFVVLGSSFLAANWIMVRRKKEVTK